MLIRGVLRECGIVNEHTEQKHIEKCVRDVLIARLDEKILSVRFVGEIVNIKDEKFRGKVRTGQLMREVDSLKWE